MPVVLSVRDITHTPVWRRWWARALLVVIALTAGLLLWSLGPWSPHTYVASRVVRVVVLPGSSSDTYNVYAAQRSEAAIAAQLSTHSYVSSELFAEAVLREIPTAATSGASGSDVFGLGTIKRSIEASHTGGSIELSASGESAAQAATLATAAANAMASPSTQSDRARYSAAGASVRMEVEAVAGAAHLDVTAERTRAEEIAVRGAVAAVVVCFVAGVLTMLRTREKGLGVAEPPPSEVNVEGER